MIEVVIVDDHPVVRSGMRTLLEASGMVVAGECGDGSEVVELVLRSQPDVVVMDLAMPMVSGVEATRRLTLAAPRVAVLVVSMSAEEESVFAALRAGARGYILKGTDPTDLVRAVAAVAHGDAVFGPELADRVLGYFNGPRSRAVDEFADLTAREREVLTLLSRGKSNLEIGRQLGIRPKTVRNYVSNVLSKLAAADRTQAILRARDAGLT